MALARILLSFAYAFFGWRLLKKLDPEHAAACETQKRAAAVAAACLLLANALCAGQTYLWHGSLFWASLALAAFCDHCTTEVYDAVFLPPMAVGCAYLAAQGSWRALLNLLLFWLLQLLLFRRLYGGADCLAFSMCASYTAVHHGALLLEHLLLMLSVFLALGIVQLLRRNVNRRGNLKEPVALIPYIATVLAIWQGFLCIYDGF